MGRALMTANVKQPSSGLFSVQLVKFKSWLNDLPSRHYYMALALLLLVTIRFVFIPWQQQLSAQKEQLQQLSRSVKAPDLIMKQAAKMEQALLVKQELQQQWLNSFYNESQSKVKVAVVNKLQGSAQKRGLLYLRSRWLKTPVKRQNEFSSVEPLLYSVMIRGDYNQIRALIQEWQAYQPLIAIEELSIEDRKDEGVVAAKFTIGVYKLKEVK